MRILIIEREPDQELFFAGKDLQVVGTKADDLPEILTLIKDCNPDVVVVDLSILPDRMENEAARKIRRQFPQLSIIGLKLFPRRFATEERAGFLNAGGDYLLHLNGLKVSEELEACMRATVRRMRPAASAELCILCADKELRIDKIAHEVMFDGRPVDLTVMEFKVLSALVAAYPKRVSMDSLINDLYFGNPNPPEGNTVAVFISRIRKKLGSGLIQNTPGFGYRLRGPDESS